MSQAMPPPPPMPPMSYAVPGMQPTRTSAAAVTSLITGLLGCLVVPALIAIITGIIGLKATKNPQVKGRGLAIAGIICGTIFGLAGSGCLVAGGGLAVFAYTQVKPAIETMNGLTEAASTGDVNKALPFVDVNKVSKAKLEGIIEQLKPLGKPIDFKPTHPNVQSNNGLTTVDLDGTLVYPNNVTKVVSVQFTKQADGTFKVTKLDLE